MSIEEYQQATAVLSYKLKSLGSSAGGAADLVSDLDDKLGDLSKVQAAISSAKTDVDINSIRSALRKLYDDGSITAKQYNEELKKTTERQQELKGAVEQGKKAQDAKNESDKEAIVTSEQLRRESGERMAQERRASGQAMEDSRRGAEAVQKDLADVENFFGGVLTRSREPLAQLSAAALEAFDKLNGISTANIELDTSSLDATTESLQQATQAMGEMQKAASTVGVSAFGKWAVETQLQSQRLQVQFLKQKASLQSLEEGYADGSITVGEFARKAESARHTLGLLNDSDLRTLEGSIESAKQKMKQLSEGSKTTLNSLRDELAQLRGEQDSIDKRRFASRQADLKQQLAEAQASGDGNAVSNLVQALGTLRQLEQESNQKRQLEQQQKRIDAQKPATATPAAAPAKIIRLETAKGKTVDVAVNADQDETNLLDILQDAGLRAL
ncbi:hypothetical protein [Pseudomonas sp. S9]|uniref:hypothetical protein n=1 Tax=Pseudomonas sp. S9 TaxID=686578 RepID=UPI0002556FFC|nr:hypothetical protein [Pseudomonas sp. S9]